MSIIPKEVINFSISGFLIGLVVLPFFYYLLSHYKKRIRYVILININPWRYLTMKAVRVELDGKERSIKFDFNAMSDFEDLMGMGVGAAFGDGQIGFRTVRALYWAGLRHKEKGLTLQRAGMLLSTEMSNGKTLEDLMEPINKAIEASGLMPKTVEEDEEFEAEDEEEAKNE